MRTTTSPRSSAPTLAVAVAVMACLTQAACHRRPTAETPASAVPDGELATIVLSLTTVPSDVACVRVIVAGNQTVARTFDVTPGQPATLTASGLPLGAATVYEETFGAACSSVHANLAATWVSEAPVPVVLRSGQETQVAVVLRRPARLRVTGDFREGAPTLSFVPGNASFGDVAVGTFSADLTFTITNMTANTLPASVSFTGPDAAHFVVVSGSCTSLIPGASCAVVTRFLPISTGSKMAELTVVGSGAGAAVVGNGISALGITLEPRSMEFPDVEVGAASAPYTFTARNRASIPLPLPIAVTGAEAAHFQIAQGGTCVANGTLAPAGTCTILVRFAPTTAGNKCADLTAGQPAGTAGMCGLGVTATRATITPPSASFGQVAVGVPSDPVTFTVRNDTGGSIALAPGITGADPGQFSLTAASTCNGLAQLLPGSSCTLIVRMLPTSAGPKSATLSANSATSATLSGTGFAGGGAAFTPGMKDFGEVVANQRVSPVHLFTLTNLGSGSMQVSLGFTGADAGHFRIVDGGTCPFVPHLPPGQSCTVATMFLPSSGGPKTAFLAALPSFGTAAVSGTGISGTGFVFNPTSFNFGEGVVGAMTSPIATFTVTNHRAQDTSLALGLTGADATHFRIVPGGSCENITRVGPGESCTVNTRFAPASTGVKTAALTAGPAGGAAPLTGTGISESGFVFDPTSVAFGSGFVNVIGPPVVVTVMNAAPTTRSMQLGFSGANADQFRIFAGGTCDTRTSLGAGESCTTRVAFAPTSAGAKSGALTVFPSMHTAPLTGNGVVGTGVVFNPPSFAFGEVVIRNFSPPTTFTVTNTRPGAITPSFTTTGTDAGDFLIVDGGTCFPGVRLNPGASCTVAVRFGPGSMGSKSAALTAGPDHGSAPLTGTGLRTAGIFLEPASVAYGVVGLGSGSTVQLTATNGTTGRLPLSSSFSGPDASQFVRVRPGTGTCENLPDLAGGASCTLDVRFQPTTVGAKTTTLAFGAGPPATLSGTAVVSAIGNLVVRDTATTNPPAGTDGIANSTQWSIQQDFRIGPAAFGDRSATISALGSGPLAGKPWIRTAADSKNFAGAPLATFTVTGRFVYLLVDDRHNVPATGKPAWLDASYTDQGYNAVIAEGTTPRPYSVWRRSVASGSTVTLPTIASAVAPCYLVVVE